MDGNITLRLKTIFSKSRAVLIASAIIFLPLIFIGTHHSHDWGDDFAQYIHQSGNIVNGIPQSETGFIYSQQNFIGPQTYPVGFPLLLSPVYALAGNNIGAFITLISLLYIVLGLLMIVFFRQYFSWITAFVLALIFMYNPPMVLFKREVMSDIPFTALLVLNFILYQKTKSGNLKQFIVLALTTGFMITVRPTGIIFIAAVIMEQLHLLIRRKIKLNDLAIRGGIIILAPLVVYYIINIFIFKIPSGGSIRDYLLFYDSGKLIDIIPENLSHHIDAFRYLFVPQAGALMGLSIILGSFVLVFALLGFIKLILQGPELTEWFFIFYVIMLLLFPNNNSAFRLMVPLIFISLFYAATGFKTIQLLPQIPGWKKALSIGLLIMLLFMPGLISIIRSGDNTIEGPQQKTAVETFKFMSKNVPAEAVVVFAKPRALALYAGCHSMADPRTKDPTLFHEQVMEANATYLLLCNQLTDELMYRYSRVMQNRLTKQFENKDFVLYKIKPVSR
jgi:4-amino-4-deoxy-L-arabinose transferase-like glycosyltransferase